MSSPVQLFLPAGFGRGLRTERLCSSSAPSTPAWWAVRGRICLEKDCLESLEVHVGVCQEGSRGMGSQGHRARSSAERGERRGDRANHAEPAGGPAHGATASCSGHSGSAFCPGDPTVPLLCAQRPFLCWPLSRVILYLLIYVLFN